MRVLEVAIAGFGGVWRATTDLLLARRIAIGASMAPTFA
ncbi:hypothetical protein PAM7066_03412 [Palleronia marisminoris]|uniref:Uncharacterized protein n=1 Tax=Palleronia marisminoris TaxID=315423 RepID=A0A1Y5TTJ5_9RHOB|nr:hypothetical protein PAM7066_03412 [Palleronia marisminoris]